MLIMNILGIGAPILDYLIQTTEDKIPGEKWGMEVVDNQELLRIIEECGSVPTQMAGGSCANAIKGLASLGHRCGFIGKIGEDAIGARVKEHMEELGVTSFYQYTKTPTAHVACLITPDGRRTLRCYMGACSEMRAEELDPKLFEGVKWVHIEGYTLLCPGLTYRAMMLAKKAGAKISFDMGSFEMVTTFKEFILYLLKQFVDVAFANKEEIKALFNSTPEEGCRMLSVFCDVAVVMVGSEGCYVGHKEKVEKIEAIPVKVIDTTGAGDLFACGFIHGYLNGLSLAECAQVGSILGSKVVQFIGAEIPKKEWEKLCLTI